MRRVDGLYYGLGGGLGLANGYRLWLLDDTLLDHGLGLGRWLRFSHDRCRWGRRSLPLEHQAHEALRHFLYRSGIDLRLR
jgi:hypothetical protein